MAIRVTGAGRASSAEIQGLLFDLDGTLAETEAVLYAAWVELAKRAGVDFRTFAYAKIIGKSDVECCRIVSEHFGLGRDPKEWCAEYDVISHRMLDEDLTLRPGVEEVLELANRLGLPKAVVTASMLPYVKKVLGTFDLFNEFDAHVTGDTPGLKAPKPDPAPYLLGAEKLGVDPRRCVAFEDSPSGLSAALGAGCFTVGIPHNLSLRVGLAKAHLIIHDLSYFRPEQVRFHLVD